MEMWLSIVGFLVVVAIIVTIMTKKLSTMVALSVIPLVGAILVGGAADIPATTVLLVCGAMIPIYKKMNMKLRNLAAILAMGSGLMNMSPWGGPTLRAAVVMETDLTQFFKPMLVPILITIAIGLIPVVMMGLSETKRLKQRRV